MKGEVTCSLNYVIRSRSWFLQYVILRNIYNLHNKFIDKYINKTRAIFNVQ